MTLDEILEDSSDSIVKEEVSSERLMENIDAIRELIAFYREYPDLLIDDIKGPECVFNFRPTQRIFLRSIMRHRYVYCTFTRGFSKSFLAIMGLMLKAILFPGSKVFVTTGGKEQAAMITISKVEEICKLIPALENEINWERGVSKKSKDSVKYIFKNGSELDILAARESTRGQRRHGGVIEEVSNIALIHLFPLISGGKLKFANGGSLNESMVIPWEAFYRNLYRLSLRLKCWGVGLLLIQSSVLGNEALENRNGCSTY